MAFLLRYIARFAAQRLAASPRAREMANKAARAALDEGKRIAGQEDRARAAGRALRRALGKLRGDQ